MGDGLAARGEGVDSHGPRDMEEETKKKNWISVQWQINNEKLRIHRKKQRNLL